MCIMVLGGGVAGLSTSFHLLEKGIESIILEKQASYGGLCGGFKINDFNYDTFAHISFDNDPETYALMEGRTEFLTHRSEALNYCDGKWVKHPVQNNLWGLTESERKRIIDSFINREYDKPINNYEDWLRNHFGDYFSEMYPSRYTRKYWTIEPNKLDYKWIEGRMTTPTLEELCEGAAREGKAFLHYSKEARYPKEGGFKAFLRPLAEDANIVYNAVITEIDAVGKHMRLQDGREYSYDEIISTIPLPELVSVIRDVPNDILCAAEKLDHTSGAIISLGFNRPKVSPSLWFYIYDEDILPARVYSPDWKSPNNVPSGCSAIQAEVYFSKYKPLKMPLDELKEVVISQLLKLDLFTRDEIILSDVRYIEYANVMFTPQIYEARDRIHKYLDSVGIYYAGRWGEWDYLWVGQSMRSGRRAVERIIRKLL